MYKYHNKKTEYDGIMFDSKREAERYAELKILERAKAIQELQRQVKFTLIPTQKINGKVAEREVSYIADFVYMEDGKMVVEDVKGFKTPEYILKRKMFLYRYGFPIKEIK